MTGISRTRAIARAAVRADISQAAFELTRERGFHNITVDDMAAAAGVSRSTLLRPRDEDDWTALRRSMEGALEYYLQDPVGALAISRRPSLTAALAERAGLAGPIPIALAVKGRRRVGVPEYCRRTLGRGRGRAQPGGAARRRVRCTLIDAGDRRLGELRLGDSLIRRGHSPKRGLAEASTARRVLPGDRIGVQQHHDAVLVTLIE